jgi:hypothetical protein
MIGRFMIAFGASKRYSLIIRDAKLMIFYLTQNI